MTAVITLVTSIFSGPLAQIVKAAFALVANAALQSAGLGTIALGIPRILQHLSRKLFRTRKPASSRYTARKVGRGVGAVAKLSKGVGKASVKVGRGTTTLALEGEEIE
ncbi:hypothetical protein BDZ97DRAFT_1921824 [Flammula alnicola]|nr:hypothetical protein BDZ97DRAFT_1921824 [Flammula alnicola]